MKLIYSILLTVSAGILLSACSFEEIFSKLATSDIEQGAREEFTQSKAIEAKQAKIDLKKQMYQESIELKNVSESNKFVAMAYRNSNQGKVSISVEAMLSNPIKGVYEVWLRGGKTDKENYHLGALQYNQTDDYSLDVTLDKPLTDYNTVLISREENLDDTPETIIMTGAFTPTSSAQEQPAQNL